MLKDNDFAKLLKEAESQGKEWIAFSHKHFGQDTREYDDLVRVYFDDRSDFKTVRLGKYQYCIEISYHHPTRFGGLTINAVNQVRNILDETRQLLSVMRGKMKSMDNEEAKKNKSLRIKKLQEELEALSA